MGSVFYPFSHHAQAQVVRQVDGGSHDLGVAFVFSMPITNDLSILSSLTGNRFEVGQRRITGTEVVNRELNPRSESDSAVASARWGSSMMAPLGDLPDRRRWSVRRA